MSEKPSGPKPRLRVLLDMLSHTECRGSGNAGAQYKFRNTDRLNSQVAGATSSQ